MTSTDPTSATRSPRQGAFIFVFITVVLDMLALGVTVPILPKLIVEFEGGNVPSAVTVNGYFAALWAGMQFIFAPLLGALSDRFGRRKIILLSIFGLGLDYFVMALAPTLSWLLLGRIISGITSSSYPTASAYIADVTPPEKRAARFGMLGAAFGIGFVIGPVVGGLLGGIDLRLPFWVAGGLCLANAAYGLFVLPESLPPEKRTAVNWRKANPVGSLVLLRSHPELFALAAATFVAALAHEALPNMFVLYTEYRYAWSVTTVSLALAAVGVCSGIVQGGLVGMTVKRLGERSAMFLGLAFGFSGFVLFGLAETGNVFLAGIPLVALWGFASPTMQSLMSQRVQATEQGRLQGAIASIRGIVGMIGPLLVANVFTLTAGPKGFIELPGTVYYFAAALVALTLVIAWRATRVRVAPVSL